MYKAVLFVFFVIIGLISCGGGNRAVLTHPPNPGDPIETGSQGSMPNQYATSFPAALPADAVQPWEQLGADGKVIPQNSKGASATSGSTEFLVGQQTHDQSGATTDWNGALRIASGEVGEGNLSYAIYRIPLGGGEPGVVSVDANLRPMADGKLGGYWVGLADYGNSSWQWFGPIMDAHWRISAVQAAREAANYTSGVGSVFVCVVAHDGAEVDIVGVGVDPVDLADTTAPDAPTNLALTPVVGGLELTWAAVGGSDVAGFKLYYSGTAFGEHTAQFADAVDGLQGRSFILDAAGQTWVAISAVDKSGNESAISTVESALPLAGSAPEVTIDATAYSVMRGESVTLTANGASLYDWDTDGDGIFDILGDDTGTADVDTSQTGLIRPLVRGTGADPTSVALGAVSVIVSSNARPVAVAKVTPAYGDAPLLVVLTGTDSTDFDGTIVGGGWDYDGDGTYDVWDDADIVHVTSAGHTYTDPGVYNAKLRVVDDEGAWDVDTVTVVVQVNRPPVAIITSFLECQKGESVTFDAQQSFDLDGTIVQYEWDLDGNGSFEYDSTPAFWAASVFNEAGPTEVGLRVTDNLGAQGVTAISLLVHGAFTVAVDSIDEVGTFTSLAIVDGNPAISYYDETNYDLKYARATDGSGSAWGTPVTVHSTGEVGNYSSLAVVNGNPAICFYDSTNGKPTYVRALDAQGNTWGTPVAVDISGSTGWFTSLLVVDGNPAISYYDANDLKYVRATDSSGVAWGTPVGVDISGNVGYYTFLAIVDGNPAISYSDLANADLKYVRATDAQGVSWGTPVAVDTGGSVGYYTSLAVVDGFPAISYNDNSNVDLKYVRATDAQGVSWGTPVAVDAGGSVGEHTSLAVVDGNPAISHYDLTNGDLMYVRSTDAQGSRWGTSLAVDTPGFIGQYTSMAIVDGNPAISYYDWTNYDLKYAMIY